MPRLVRPAFVFASLLAFACSAGGCNSERDPAVGQATPEEEAAKKTKIMRDLYPQAAPKNPRAKVKKG